MSRFLLSFYPIDPWRSLLCCEINDKMDTGDAKDLLEEYYRGLAKHNMNEGDLLMFNNTTWQLIKANSVFEAIDTFKENLNNWRTSNE